MCSCGKHSARLQLEGKKKRKWECYAVKKAGNKPRLITMRAEKMDARDVVAALCDGSYELHNRPRDAPIQPTRTVRQRDSSKIQCISTAAPRATQIAGPGRGHKGERVTSEDPLTEAEQVHVLKKPKVSDKEWRHALGRLTDEHKLLQQWCGKVCARCVVCVVVLNRFCTL